MYGLNKKPSEQLLVSNASIIQQKLDKKMLLLSGSILHDQAWLEEWVGHQIDHIYTWGSLNLASNAKFSEYSLQQYDMVFVDCFSNDAYCNATPIHLVACALNTFFELWPKALFCFMFVPETRPNRQLERIYRHEYNSIIHTQRNCAWIDATLLENTLVRYDKRHMDKSQLQKFGRILEQFFTKDIPKISIPTLLSEQGDTPAVLVYDRENDIRINGKRMKSSEPDAIWWADDSVEITGVCKKRKVFVPDLVSRLWRYGYVDVTYIPENDRRIEVCMHTFENCRLYKFETRNILRLDDNVKQIMHPSILRADLITKNSIAYQFSLGFDGTPYFERLKNAQMIYTKSGSLSRPRIDARRDNCEWLWEFCKSVISTHGDMAGKFGMEWNSDLESCVHNVIAFHQEHSVDGLDWHLDEKNAIALVTYDTGGIDFKGPNDTIIEHRACDQKLCASIAYTNKIYHRSVIVCPRNAIVIFFKTDTKKRCIELDIIPASINHGIGEYEKYNCKDGMHLELLTRQSPYFSDALSLLTTWFPNENIKCIDEALCKRTAIILLDEECVMGVEIARFYDYEEHVILHTLYIVTKEGTRGYGSLMHNCMRYLTQHMYVNKSTIDFTFVDDTRQARQFWKKQGLKYTKYSIQIAKDIKRIENSKMYGCTPMLQHI